MEFRDVHLAVRAKAEELGLGCEAKGDFVTSVTHDGKPILDVLTLGGREPSSERVVIDFLDGSKAFSRKRVNEAFVDMLLVRLSDVAHGCGGKEASLAAVRQAVTKTFDGVRLTNRDRLALILQNGNWVHGSELARRCGWRFGAAVYELRRVGCVIEKRRYGDREWEWEYRMVV